MGMGIPTRDHHPSCTCTAYFSCLLQSSLLPSSALKTLLTCQPVTQDKIQERDCGFFVCVNMHLCVRESTCAVGSQNREFTQTSLESTL